MAAMVRRNWPVLFVVVCASLLLLSLILPRAFQSSSVAQVAPASTEEAFAPQSATDYAVLHNLRRETGLDNDALVALNLTPEALESTLAAMRNWYDQNQAQLKDLEIMVGQKASALRGIDTKIRIGPRDESVLANRPLAVQELASARARRGAFLDGLVRAVESPLTQDQVTLLATLRANRDQSLPYRILALTAEQKTALQAARQKVRAELAAARTSGQPREAATAAWRTQEATILTALQQRTVLEFRQHAATAAERVLAAEHKVLPVVVDEIWTPEELPQG